MNMMTRLSPTGSQDPERLSVDLWTRQPGRVPGAPKIHAR